MEIDTQILSTILMDVLVAFYKIFFISSTITAAIFSVVRLVHIDKEQVSCAYRSSKKIFLWCICLGTGFAAISAVGGVIRGSGVFPISTFLISAGANFHWMSKEVDVISQITDEYND